MNLGILLAFVSLFGWAFGDFLIQKSTRVFGITKTLFTIGLISTPTVLPFIYKDILQLTIWQHLQLTLLSLLVLAYASSLFKAFKVGKLSVVESVIALELPIAVSMAFLFLGEKLGGLQIFLFIIICLGVLLASVKDVKHLHYHKHFVEPGVWLAIIATFLAAGTNIFISSSAQTISPLVTLWYQHAFLVFVLGIYMTYKFAWKEYFLDIKTHPHLIFGQGIFDNIAWLAFVFAVVYTPTSLVLTISEGYIILAGLLGHFLNKEKLKNHQILGALIAIPAVILLAFISE